MIPCQHKDIKPLKGGSIPLWRCSGCGHILTSNKSPKAHKYGAKAVKCKQGHLHPSRIEGMHCWDLYAQMQAGLVRDVEFQKTYELIVNGILVGTHRPDFTFKRPSVKKTHTSHRSYTVETDWENPIICVDEVKGVRTSDWVFRSKVFLACYPDVKYRVIQ